MSSYPEIIAKQLQVRPNQVDATIRLLDEGNTVPFISRYRKEMTGTLDDEQVRIISDELARLRGLDERRATILVSIEEQGKLADELRQAINAAVTLTALEDLYAPYKPKRRTRASIAREKGLEGLADHILKQTLTPRSMEEIIKESYLSEQVPTVEEALQGARDIVAEIISDHTAVRQATREKALKFALLTAEKSPDAEDDKRVYESYYTFECRVDRLQPHQVLALNRGEKEGILKVHIKINERDWRTVVESNFAADILSPFVDELFLAENEAAERLLLPSIERDVRRELSEKADSHAINVFATNLRALLSLPPLAGHVTLGIDPGFRTGSKVAVVDPTGKLLDTATIYPHEPKNDWSGALTTLEDMVNRHHVTLVTIGNGTASRETEKLVAELTRGADSIKYLIVNEAGASVYSASALARQEFPDLDVSIRGAASIARRAQDPLAELVKIDPKSIGVGLYQHDVDQAALSHALDGVVESVVNNVGVDVNTASPALLTHVAGVGPKLANNIVSYRDVNGAFHSRTDLRQVSGLGPKAFEQAAGFLRIRAGTDPLDASAIHPESYPVARLVLERAGLSPTTPVNERKPDLDALLAGTPLEALAAELNCGLPTLKDIFEQLVRPGRDPRSDTPLPILRSDVLKVEDLAPGMTLKGTVRNVVDFGAFVDIGVKHDGLLHRTQIPFGTVLKVGDIIDLEILKIEPERNRISLGWRSSSAPMSIHALLNRWHSDPETAPNLPIWRTSPPRLADLCLFPADLPHVLADSLIARGITSLYSHQVQAWESARRGENVVLATGTASGKTLGYNLPVLAALLEDPQARALYLFPTKALTQDQLSSLNFFQSSIENLRAAIYDGDTPTSHRSAIRKSANILFTNPDMLHTGILPHHTNWGDFFRNLRFVVIDEMHTYRGVFGSHVANVIRRLKRVGKFYGTFPQFILTSATIGNPQELAGRLIESPVTLVNADGSARGERHFLVYNPPVVDPALGIRKSATQESVRLAQDLLAQNVQTVVFARSRRSVEILLTYLQGSRGWEEMQAGRSSTNRSSSTIRGYRSGYLPAQRREIERGLRDGSIRLVVATNALELGIDIGGLEAALLVGYPGTIASTWQQAGRAGRGDDPALAIFVATANPLDQFLAHHPEYFFARSPEQALINPDHLLILLNHLRCAAFELPFQPDEGFGEMPAEKLKEFLDFLVSSQELHQSDDKYFWMADAYPASAVSLRSASPENVLLQVEDGQAPHLLGEVDLASAAWMVHPRAVYLHEGQQYFVQDLNLTRNLATLIPVGLDYYTEPLRQTEVSLQATIELAACPALHGSGEACTKAYGELLVTTQVTGFRKRSWLGGENLGEEPLDLPPSELQTTGYWLTLSEQTIEALRLAGNWTNDPNDYGPGWNRLREAVRQRDGYRCQVCGTAESGNRQHDVHHKIPFRQFISPSEANRLENLITLCPACHRKAETNLRMRSGLAGLATVLGQLAPLFLMCDSGDLGIYADPTSAVFGRPSVVIYDQVPVGIGFSQKLFEIHGELLRRALELVEECECEDGCPSCVGPAGENGIGGKQETLAILEQLTARDRDL